MRKIMNFNDMIRNTYDLYRENFWKTIGYSILMRILIGIIAGIAMIPLILIITGVSVATIGNFDNLMFENNIVLLLILGIIIFFVILLIAQFVNNFIMVGFIKLVELDNYQHKITFSNLFSIPFNRIKAILSASIIKTIISIMPLAIVFVFAVFTYRNLTIGVGMKIFIYIFIGIVFLVIYIYVSIKSIFVLQISVNEDIHFLKSLKRSIQLTKDNTWHVFKLTLGNYIATSVLSYSLLSITIIAVGISQVIIINDNNIGYMISMFFTQIFSYASQLFVNAFIIPFHGVFITYAYYNQLSVKEGYDIKIKLDKLINRLDSSKGTEMTNEVLVDNV